MPLKNRGEAKRANRERRGDQKLSRVEHHDHHPRYPSQVGEHCGPRYVRKREVQDLTIPVHPS